MPAGTAAEPDYYLGTSSYGGSGLGADFDTALLHGGEFGGAAELLVAAQAGIKATPAKAELLQLLMEVGAGSSFGFESGEGEDLWSAGHGRTDSD